MTESCNYAYKHHVKYSHCSSIDRTNSCKKIQLKSLIKPNVLRVSIIGMQFDEGCIFVESWVLYFLLWNVPIVQPCSTWCDLQNNLANSTILAEEHIGIPLRTKREFIRFELISISLCILCLSLPLKLSHILWTSVDWQLFIVAPRLSEGTGAEGTALRRSSPYTAAATVHGLKRSAY